MRLQIEVPHGSVYMQMYKWGLRHIPLEDIERAVMLAGKNLRKKDVQNYWNGWHNSNLYGDIGMCDEPFKLVRTRAVPSGESFLGMEYGELPEHPYDEGDVLEMEKRYVPCSAANKPLIQWSKGCLVYEDALAYSNQVYMAENLRGTHLVVVDCDGDHDDESLDLETIMFLWNRFSGMTHTLMKQKRVCDYSGYEESGLTMPASFHLTFTTDKMIPKIACPDARIDILGNQNNQLRYFKTKVWNGLGPAPMTAGIWDDLREYAKYRKEKANGR